MTIKQKFSSIDQSKLTTDQKAFLDKIKNVTKNFSDTEMNKKVEQPLDNFIAKAKEKMPEAIKSAPAKKSGTKAKPSQTQKPKRTAMSLAKEIRKEGESWAEARARASKAMKEDSKDLSKTVETELDKLSKLVRSQKNKQKLVGISGTDIRRDSVRKAKPRGQRTVTHSGETSNKYGTFSNKLGRKYYESRDNRTDRLSPNYPKNAPLLENGAYLTDPNFGNFQNQVLEGGGRISTNEQLLNSFLTSNKEVKVGNLSTHYSTLGNVMLLRNYGTLIAKREGNKISISNKKYSKTTTSITNLLQKLAKNNGMKIMLIEENEFEYGGGIKDNYAFGGLFKNKRPKSALMRDRNNVNHSEDYEVRYSRPRPSRTGYSGNRRFAGGGRVESLTKELHRLQRELNSSRLQTYRLGDVSQEAIDRKKEREVKLARFNEVLKELRETDEKFALGGTVVTDLAGHTGGGDGGLNAGMPLDGFSNTSYTGLVGETGAMSSGEMFMAGGSVNSKFDLAGFKRIGMFETLDEAKKFTDLDRYTSTDYDTVVIKDDERTTKPFVVFSKLKKGQYVGNRVYANGGGVDDKEFSLAQAIDFIKKSNKDKMTFYYNVYGGDDYFTLQPTFATPTGKLKGYPRKVTITEEGNITGRNLTYENGGGLPEFSQQSYVITEALGNPAQHFSRGGVLGQSAKVDFLTEEFASQDLIDELKSKLNIEKDNVENEDVIAFAYTDYGGSIIDKYAIEYFLENYPNNIVVESTIYNGKNAFVFGDTAKEWMEQTEDYPLGFEDFESFYMEKENEDFEEGIDFFIQDLKRDYDFDEDKVKDALFEEFSGYFNVYTNGLDYSEEKMINYLSENNLIEKEYAKGGGIRINEKNGREYPIGRSWTNEHNHTNKSENYEVKYNRKNKIMGIFKNGGEFMTDPTFGNFQNQVYADGGDIDSKNITMAKRVKVKKWYLKTYPTDDLGEEINPDIDFWLLWKYISQGYNVYNVLGVGDSVIRERVFEKLSEILGIDYDVIYNKWLHSDNYAKGGGVDKPLKRYKVYKNGTQQGELYAKNLREAEGMVIATYGERREVYEAEESEEDEEYNKGGAIKNQYANRTPEDIWNKLSVEQRKHFLLDHISGDEEIEQIKYRYAGEDNREFIDEYSNKEWKKLSSDIKQAFREHVKIGQYNKGGSVTNERKHVNHNEDYEIRYAKPRPSRKGYKGAIKFMAGGSMETPRIYVADLEAYNNGRLVGEWLDLADYNDADELMEAIQDVLKKSGGEEYAIHDVEYIPRSMYSEYMGKSDFEELYEMMDLAKDNNLPLEVVQEVVSQYDASAVYEFQGKYDNAEDFAEQLVDEMGGLENFSSPEYYVYITDTDRRLLAGEMADSYTEDIRDEDGGNRLIEEAGLNVDEYEDASDETKEEMLDLASSMVNDEYYDNWYEGLSDPYEFLVEEQGMYSPEDFFKASFIRVDYEKLARDLEQDYTFIEHDGDLYVFNIR